MIRAIVIDDEKASRDTLNGMLKRYCHNVDVVGEAGGYQSGLDEIKKHQPDVIFLDIQMPDGSGFKLLEDVGEINFEIIFTTAYDQYAVKAIKYAALDYLLKPIVPDDLVNAVAKVEQKKNSGQINKQIRVLVDNILHKEESKKLILSTFEKIHVVNIEDIIRCESDDCYTHFYFVDHKTLMVSKTLKDIEKLLSEEEDFIRPHRSHLINVKYIRAIEKSENGFIIMSDGAKIPVSRRKRDVFRQYLGHINDAKE
jgi:two-component system, LytTR family, response regulator